MRTWLLTWNAERWHWTADLYGYPELINDIASAGRAYTKWTCGVNKSIEPGDRLFLIKLGSLPRGIVASGRAVTKVFEGTHWDQEKEAQGKKARRIVVKFDTRKDYKKDSTLAMERLKELSDKYCWSAQSSGLEIPQEIADLLEKEWANLR